MVDCQSGSNTDEHSAPGVWQTSQKLTPSPIDIVSFAFAHLHKIDPNKPIYLDARNPSKFITAPTVQTTVGRLAKGLQNFGLKPGECVSIHSFNNISYPLLWLSVIAARGCVSGSNPASTDNELVHHFNITGSQYVIAHESCLDPLIKAATICNIPPSKILVFNDDWFSTSTAQGQAEVSGRAPDSQSSKLIPLTSLLTEDEISWSCLDEDESLQDEIAVYAITSGTTGLPKAAAISQKSLIAQGLSIEGHFVGRRGRVAQLLCLPVFHAFAAPLAMVLPLRLGIPTYLLPRFRLDEYVRSIARHIITDSAIVPKIASSLLTLSQSDRESLQSLRYLMCAGAPMNPEVQAKLYQDLSPELVIAQCWGATELGWATLFGPSEKDNTGSVGYPLPGVDLKIVKPETASVLTKGEIGEVCVRSPSLFSGYRDNPRANASAFDEEGFYRTGDRASFRERKLYLHGRIADTMKVNGWQVSPEELEHILNQHPMVSDSAVIGIIQKSASGLEETFPRAYVVPRRWCAVSEEEIQAFVSSRVIAYKKLSGGIIFVSKIPRNPTGKILRRLLRT